MLTSFASCLWRSWLAFFSVGRKSSTLERADRHHDRVRSSFTISFSFLRTRHGERRRGEGKGRTFASLWFGGLKRSQSLWERLCIEHKERWTIIELQSLLGHRLPTTFPLFCDVVLCCDELSFVLLISRSRLLLFLFFFLLLEIVR